VADQVEQVAHDLRGKLRALEGLAQLALGRRIEHKIEEAVALEERVEGVGGHHRERRDVDLERSERPGVEPREDLAGLEQALGLPAQLARGDDRATLARTARAALEARQRRG
jgi:hypothetical protein